MKPEPTRRVGARPGAAIASRLAVLLIFSLCVLAQDASAKSAEAAFHFDVPEGQWKGARIQDIPKGAKLSVEIESDGPVAILLLDAVNYARFPEPKGSVFRGQTSGNLSFSVLAPVTSDYFLLIDNREGSAARSVEIGVRGETDDDAASEAAAEEKLREFEQQLGRIFHFDPFPIRVKKCGKPLAFSDGKGIVLCREYASHLYARLGDREKASDALIFTLFHEVGHVLLEQWGYPMYASEETADEFATAVMVMVGHGERVRAKAEFFRANPSLLEALAKAFQDDRHPLSEQRSRNILRWADDPELVRRWQTIFVPHMQTAVLERLEESPTPWTNGALVEKELASRR
jgi:hypothetical protein